MGCEKTMRLLVGVAAAVTLLALAPRPAFAQG
jgi:hypothetical protein